MKTQRPTSGNKWNDHYAQKARKENFPARSVYKLEEMQKKYKTQLNSVKNNREFEALNKELEIAGLEILAAEKRIKEAHFHIDAKKDGLEKVKETIASLKKDLDFKKKELKTIVNDTEAAARGLSQAGQVGGRVNGE